MDTATTYFSTAELIALKSIEGKTLEKVIYYVWQNKVNPNEIFESLDWIQFVFSDDTLLTITSGENSDQINVTSLQFEEEQSKITQAFGNSIGLVENEMTYSELWYPATIHPISSVELNLEDNQLYSNKAMLLQFEDYHLLIRLDELEGLNVELVEEDDL